MFRAVRVLRAAPRGNAMRRMCTAVVEEATVAAEVSPFSIKNPDFNTLLIGIGAVYIGTFRWMREDKKLEAALAEIAAAKHVDVPGAEEVVEVVAEAEAPVSAVAAAVAAAPSGAANPAMWKVADVTAWLDTIELSQHAPAFKTHSIDGKLLLTLTEQDLYSILNIVSPLHRKKIMMAVGELRSSFVNP